MATQIGRVEKDFLLKILHDEQIPVVYVNNRTEYPLLMEKPSKAKVFFKSDRPIAGIKPHKKLNLLFGFLGKALGFNVEVSSFRDNHLVASAPEFLYKNLNRSFSRVSLPPDLRVQFVFRGKRYFLPYPKIREYESEDIGEWMEKTGSQDIQEVIDQMGSWIHGFASEYKIVIFREVKPQTTEERIVAETGKSLYLASTTGNFPQFDPYPKKRLITEEMFRRYLETIGVDPRNMDNVVHRFIKEKFDAGVYSDIWMPILFQNYVIGYIHTWNSKQGKSSLGDNEVETLYRFTKMLSYSFKINGFFDSGLMRNTPWEEEIVDISVSGLLFACPHSSNLSPFLLPGSELVARFIAPERNIQVVAKITRRHKEHAVDYIGCQFMDMASEDERFLFEYLYGRPFAESGVGFLSGRV
ncbi:MAG: PilZ domain-containing protein [Treponema sp.]|jgi:hypothetical protein|nr:PilZ domain-containing protein [Treponema sp.]